MTPRDSPNQQGKVRNILVLAHKVPGFPDFYQAAIKEVLHCHAAELSKGDTEELTALSVYQKIKKIVVLFVKRPQLISSALNEGIERADDTIHVDV